jgi:hypothetical protein
MKYLIITAIYILFILAVARFISVGGAWSEENE